MLKALEETSPSKNNYKSSTLAVYVRVMRFQVEVDSFELFDEVMNYKTVSIEPITLSNFLYTYTQNTVD